MIKLENLSFRYAGTKAGQESLLNISLHIRKGECILLTGESGCGKTTLTRVLNGLCPRFYEGELSGAYLLAQQNTGGLSLSDIGRQVGSVFQDPRSQFFCTNTTDEVVFSMEARGYPRPEMERRLEALFDILPVENLLEREIFTLSSGEKQKIAIASVCATAPKVLVLDEPSANLDADSIEQLGRLLAKLKEQGHTLVISEHRLHYLAKLMDRMLVMEGGRIVKELSRAEALERHASFYQNLGLRSLALPVLACGYAAAGRGKPCAQAEKIYLSRGTKEILQEMDLSVYAGEILAITGSNGAGKTTFCRVFTGADKENSGIVRYGGIPLKPKNRIRKSFFVQQDADYQLYTETVEKELMLGIENTEETRKRMEQYLGELNLLPYRKRHPASLSGGQKQRVLLAAAALRRHSLIVLDEPTSGLDGRHMRKTALLLRRLAAGGTCIVLITHDIEFIESCVNRIVHIENGKIAYVCTLAQKQQP